MLVQILAVCFKTSVLKMIPRQFSVKFPRQFSVTMFPRQFDVTVFPRPFGVTILPRQFGVTVFPEQFNVTMFSALFSAHYFVQLVKLMKEAGTMFPVSGKTEDFTGILYNSVDTRRQV